VVFYISRDMKARFLRWRWTVLKSYEAVYDHGELKWIGDQPPDGRMRVIVTVIDEESRSRQATALELLEQTRGCVDPAKSPQAIASDLRDMREQWGREWDR
jgi:hypothetical protein